MAQYRRHKLSAGRRIHSIWKRAVVLFALSSLFFTLIFLFTHSAELPTESLEDQNLSVNAHANYANELVATGNIQAGPKEVASQTPNMTTAPLHYVVKVVDGDTIWVDIDGVNTKIRFIGINTPESTNKVECYGNEASSFLKDLLSGKSVSLEYDDSQGLLDKYGRTLAYVYLDGVNINLKLIESGYAYEYTYSSAYKYQSIFRNAELTAKNKQLGLWSSETCNGKK